MCLKTHKEFVSEVIIIIIIISSSSNSSTCTVHYINLCQSTVPDAANFSVVTNKLSYLILSYLILSYLILSYLIMLKPDTKFINLTLQRSNNFIDTLTSFV